MFYCSGIEPAKVEEKHQFGGVSGLTQEELTRYFEWLSTMPGKVGDRKKAEMFFNTEIMGEVEFAFDGTQWVLTKI